MRIRSSRYIVSVTTQWVHSNTGQHETWYQTKNKGGTGGGGRGADEEEGIERNKDEGWGRKKMEDGRERRKEEKRSHSASVHLFLLD